MTAVILLVEDDPGHARLFEKSLRREGVENEIVHVSSGNAALDYLHGNERPSELIIILDLNMPGLNGIQVLERLSETPELNAIPRIIMTTSDEPDDMRQCDKFGYHDYTIKPPDYARLAAMIAELEMA
jgi:CheY-like chemotaxis protein